MFVRRRLYVSLLPCCTFVSKMNDSMVSLSVGMDPTSQPKKPLISTTYSLTAVADPLCYCCLVFLYSILILYTALSCFICALNLV